MLSNYINSENARHCPACLHYVHESVSYCRAEEMQDPRPSKEARPRWYCNSYEPPTVATLAARALADYDESDRP